jgi:hypothetical protein
VSSGKVRGAYEAPKDYAAVWLEFYEPTKRWVRQKGVPDGEVEDVAQDVLTKFMEKDGLTYYDPHKTFDTGVHTQRIPGARMRRATFSGYMRGFVTLYCLNYRDKILKTHHREGTFRLDAPLSTDSTVTWIDTLVSDGDMEERAATGADCAQVINLGVVLMRRRDNERRDAESMPKSRLRQRDWTLEDGFAVMADSLARFGSLDRVWIGEQLRISPSQVATMLSEMRTLLRDVGAHDALGA